jgi:hypothetical protein
LRIEFVAALDQVLQLGEGAPEQHAAPPLPPGEDVLEKVAEQEVRLAAAGRAAIETAYRTITCRDRVRLLTGLRLPVRRGACGNVFPSSDGSAVLKYFRT